MFHDGLVVSVCLAARISDHFGARYGLLLFPIVGLVAVLRQLFTTIVAARVDAGHLADRPDVFYIVACARLWWQLEVLHVPLIHLLRLVARMAPALRLIEGYAAGSMALCYIFCL